MPRTSGVFRTPLCPHSSSHVQASVLRVLLVLILFISQSPALLVVQAQSAAATLSGTVMDQNGALIRGANIAVINTAQAFQRNTRTNDEGAFVIPLLPPGNYTLKAEHEGFKTAEIRNVVLNVSDYINLQISLNVGPSDQQVDVSDSPSLVDQSTSVGGTVDSELLRLPLNGRSFGSLFTLIPGVVLTKANGSEQGQFSVNGQRANANAFTIDGVSANISVPTNATAGQSASGSLPGLSAAGGTNNLVSMDALQEFKVETSSYAPEFGRTPGAQVLISTRSGTNQWHGSLFEYFRNDVLDANDWFANNRGQAKPPLRQNNFGGVFGGPVLIPRFGEGGKPIWYDGKDRTFFFFSYEGLRLRQPTFAITDVPALSARTSAPLSIQPFLNAYPRPTGPPRANNFAEFAAGFSNPSSFDATSVRLDHHVNDKLSLFGRYSNSPSETTQRGVLSSSLNTQDTLRVKTQTLTGGATWLLNSSTVAEFRANYSHNADTRTFGLDSFGGAAVPAESLLFPSFASSEDSNFSLFINGGRNATIRVGRNFKNAQRQLNFVNSVSHVNGAHELKAGIDFRRLSPSLAPRLYGQATTFFSMATALTGTAFTVGVSSQRGPVEPVYLNWSFYGQDNWKITRRLSLTYGLRYEINPPPSEANGKDPATLTQLNDPHTFALAPAGRSLWNTTYNNFAPRIGVNFQLSQKPGRETALRGGYGIFYDMGSGVGGDAFINYPYSGLRTLRNIAFPLVSAADIAPPPVGVPPIGRFFVFDPELKLPYTHQWNLAAEQSLGKNQVISASYVAAIGRRLLRQEQIAGALLAGNPLFSAASQVFVTKNNATSDFHAFQLRFQRRLTNKLQALSYYTWSHSIDTASNDSSQFGPTLLIDPHRDRGSSDFDIRHSFNLAVTYDLPTPEVGRFGKAVLGNWTLDTIVAARSATPVEVTSTRDAGFGLVALRPDLIEGMPLYLDDANVAGGSRFNRAAFRVPTALRQGTLGRNVLRGFPLFQTDFGLARRFKLTEASSLEFKAEFFNLFNHPNFGDPIGSLDDPTRFGTSIQMYSKSLGSGGTLGGLNPLYQVGGSRSVQLSLRAQF